MCMDCERLHEELSNQSHEMYLLRQEIAGLETKLNKSQNDKRKMVKEKKKDMKLKYKNRNRKSKYKEFYGYL